MGSIAKQSGSIPTEGWAGVVVDEGPNFKFEVIKVPVPEPGPGDVLIKLNVTGLCLSDVKFMEGDIGFAKMSQFGVRSPGHEGAGVIVKVGSNVQSLEVGQRVGYKPIWDVCHSCELCRTGKDNYCPSLIQTGIRVPGKHPSKLFRLFGADTDVAKGSYQQYVLSPERSTILIPDGVSDHVAGPTMCSGATAWCSIKTSGLRVGQWAVFVGGGGGVGMQGVQLAHTLGARVIVVDTGAKRRELTKKYGAEHFIDFKEVADPVAEVINMTGIGAHGVFVTAISAYPTAVGYLGTRYNAKLMCIGLGSPGKYTITLDPTASMFGHHNQWISGTAVSSMSEIDEALQFAVRGKLELEPTVVGLSGWPDAVEKLKRGEVAGRMVMDFNLP